MPPAWRCDACTLVHEAEAANFLSCRLCGTTKPSPQPSWGLKPPSARDITPRNRSKGFDAPIPPFEYIVVLDFEWTADNRRAVLPVSEIIQWPSVLVRLGHGVDRCTVVDEFDTFVKPTLNPLLTAFSKQLCGITQHQVDSAPEVHVAVQLWLRWLESFGLCAGSGVRWALCTWSDADFGGQLSREFKFKQLKIPECCHRWIDLKVLFGRHYKRAAKGGLQACVESLGLKFEGRAHNGLVDAQNTAKIVLHMARSGFVFKRTTRGLDVQGVMFGAKRKREEVETVRGEGDAVGDVEFDKIYD